MLAESRFKDRGCSAQGGSGGARDKGGVHGEQNTASCHVWAQAWPQTISRRAEGRGPEKTVTRSHPARQSVSPALRSSLQIGATACPALSERWEGPLAQ